jgi:hypothetical protein
VPPVQPSLRGSLLTGASALALSVSGAGAQAQNAPNQNSQATVTPWTIWVEGALFQTGGGNFSVPALPGLGGPFPSFSPQGGLEGAFGFDYRWPWDRPWHFVFDFRYGQSRQATAGSSSFHSTPFFFTGAGFVFAPNGSATSTRATEDESHLVADFMIGRDLGIGANTPELEIGIRVADLSASANMQQAGSTFYSSLGVRTTATQSAVGSWNSGFFGAGPRVAIVGGIPIVGLWSFDYGAGIAGLIGDRSFNFGVTTSTGSSFSGSSDATIFVFNADGSAALSYWLSTSAKLSAGIRADFYDSALTTYNVNTGALESLSRTYWGPFVRLTGKF